MGAIATILLLGGIALDLTENTSVAAQIGERSPAAGYFVEQGTAFGGRYRLTNPAWHVNGIASGGAYRLQGPQAPALRGSGCCCSYLPILLRNR